MSKPTLEDGSPSLSGYGGEGAVLVETTASPTADRPIDGLPFTGLDLGVLLCAGVALAALGAGLWSWAKQDKPV